MRCTYLLVLSVFVSTPLLAVIPTPISEIGNVVAECGKILKISEDKLNAWVPGSVRSAIQSDRSILGAFKQKLSSTEKAKEEQKKKDAASKIKALNKELDAWVRTQNIYASTHDLAKENENQLLSLGQENALKEKGLKSLDARAAQELKNFQKKCSDDVFQINAMISQ